MMFVTVCVIMCVQTWEWERGRKSLYMPYSHTDIFTNSDLADTEAVFIIFPSQKHVSIPTIKTRMQMPSETPFSSCCIYHRTLSRVRVERKALSLRSCIAQFYPWSRGRVRTFTQVGWRYKRLSKRLCVYRLYGNVFLAQSRLIQITLFSAFQKGFSNPLIKTALRLSSAKITMKVVWNP